MLNELYHALNPVALAFGPVHIYWYGLAYVVGAVLVGLVMRATSRRWGLAITDDDLMTVVVAAVFGLLVGARLFYVVFYGDGFYWSHPDQILAFSNGGMSFHGGLVGGVVGGLIACRVLRLSAWTVCDLVIVGVPCALFLGRCANFVNGELWGKPTDLPWGVVFDRTGGGQLPRHPSQLYEALLEGVALYLVLGYLARRRPVPPQGTFLGTFLVGYGVIRCLIEFVRVPDAQVGYLVGPVTMGQVLSLPLIAAGVVVLLVARRRAAPQTDYLDGADDEGADGEGAGGAEEDGKRG